MKRFKIKWMLGGQTGVSYVAAPNVDAAIGCIVGEVLECTEII